jgi:hypothetical protein
MKEAYSEKKTPVCINRLFLVLLLHIQCLHIAAKANTVRTDIYLKYFNGLKKREILYWNKGNETEVPITRVAVYN